MAVEEELERFIEEIHKEPYDLLANNCIHKHIRIVNKATELGYDAGLIGCMSVLTVKPLANLPLLSPHFYAQIDGELVDVTMEPALEEVVCRNEDVIRLFPVNLTRLRPMSPFEGPPLPVGYFPPWPWAVQ